MNRLLVTIALGALFVGCNKPDASVAAASEAGAVVQTSKPVAPFTGALTGERVMGSKGLVHPFDAWPDAQAKLEGQMGKATLVKDDKKFLWGVAQGDDCWYVEVDKQANGTVGAVTEPMKVSKGGPIMNWDECLSAAGVRKDAAEDPNAPGPPAAAKAITVLDLRDGATKARSKWSKAKVTVHGLYMSTTNLESNGVPTANVSITAAKADLKNVISCNLADAKTAPAKMMQYDPITVSGSVEVHDMLTGGGDRVVDVELRDCSLVSAKK